MVERRWPRDPRRRGRSVERGAIERSGKESYQWPKVVGKRNPRKPMKPEPGERGGGAGAVDLGNPLIRSFLYPD